MNIFVEGKIEEDFFEAMTDKIITISGYKKINIMALGGYYSEKLIANLHRFASNYIFIVEDSQFNPARHHERTEKLFENKPFIYMKPIMDYINLELLYTDEEFLRYLPKIMSISDTETIEFAKEFEMRLFKRNPSLRESLIHKIVQKYLQIQKIEDFINEIKTKISK